MNWDKVSDKASAKKNQADFLKRYGRFHIPWMKELIAAYKERGQFPLYPTFIANYYEDERDKELAILATICLKWTSDVMKQIKSLMSLMGEHPYEWFQSRGFVLLSIGKNQEKRLMSTEGRTYWKIAKFFSMLYDLCDGRAFRTVFPAGKDSTCKSRLARFGEDVDEVMGCSYCVANAEIVELVLRASDGFSYNLWPTDPSKIKCPSGGLVNRFLKVWFPDYDETLWNFSEAVKLFGLEKDYDFFYFYLAWDELKKANRDGCVKYSTRYISRYKGGYIMGPVFWTGKRGLIPKIEFLE